MFVVSTSRPSPLAFRPLDHRFDRAVDHALGSLFGRATSDADNVRSPALDVAETEQHYTVQIEMPGIAKDDVDVSVEGRRVTVRAQPKAASPESAEQPKADEPAAARVVYRERSATRFSRSFTLPAELEQGESSAKLDSGVLTLTLAKRRAANTARITVN